MTKEDSNQNQSRLSTFMSRAAWASAGVAAVSSVVVPFIVSSAAGSAAMASVNSIRYVPHALRGIMAVHAGAQSVNTANLIGSLGGYRLVSGAVSSAVGLTYASVLELYDTAMATDSREVARDIVDPCVDIPYTKAPEYIDSDSETEENTP